MKYCKVYVEKEAQKLRRKVQSTKELVSFSDSLSLNTDMHTCSKKVKKQSFAKLESKYNFFP